MRIGILAIQGDFEAHGRLFEQLGAEVRYVRSPEDIEGINGLVLPGGESTTHTRVLREEGLRDAIVQYAKKGGAIFGTCAGAILLAQEVKNPPQESLGLLHITILRNGYGRQLASEIRTGQTKLSDAPFEMVFIRAPVIESVGPEVEVLAESGGHPVLVRQGRLLAATFHPELTQDPAIHKAFLLLARNGS